MPRDTSRLKKRIMLNLDGTGQSAYSKKADNDNGKVTSYPVSNVARIGRATLLEDEENRMDQIVYYQSGIGAKEEVGLLQTFRESGLGQGLVSNVKEAYAFLCNNYDYGDEIFITGFSRGAYTARSVAGLIGRCGLLTKRGLESFYEAFDYYENKKKYDEEEKAKGKQSPTLAEQWVKDGTTRMKFPTGEPITIKAVGVWDTVGALSGDYSFHDVGIGEHIQNGYQMLSLEECRGYYEPTLWESTAARGLEKKYKNLEQCWMPGDHSNVGGSWEEQQLSDISLAWMMSRFEVLGVKFDQNYLYNEYQKFNKFIADKAPKLTGSNDEGPAYPKELSPRTWGEGRVKTMSPKLYYGGNVPRTPAMYHEIIMLPEQWFPPKYERLGPGPKLLKNTNETFHASVRYRHFCKNNKQLGPDDQGPYDPISLSKYKWSWPSAQKDGRIGAGGDPSTITKARPFKYSLPQDDGPIEVTESEMGRHEQIYLAFYDQDPKLRKRDGSGVWKEVMGGDGPPDDIKAIVARLREGKDVN